MPIDPFAALNAMLRAEVARASVPESEPGRPAAHDAEDIPERPSATRAQNDGI
ncbi:hypothetical protein [Streptomyces sp. H39-S7]|uniref:hypothetical protein n=1 Tax=Streptomyces sp. H39-S7 TaxID=3004357 RepID=UPI0022AFC504|nr:hypothetical protein [Streptomyces sp. H39-S7]MCZ4119472.1 hypothetical protein [Streptomyces sp. H39-S7]